MRYSAAFYSNYFKLYKNVTHDYSKELILTSWWNVDYPERCGDAKCVIQLLEGQV